MLIVESPIEYLLNKMEWYPKLGSQDDGMQYNIYTQDI